MNSCGFVVAVSASVLWDLIDCLDERVLSSLSVFRSLDRGERINVHSYRRRSLHVKAPDTLFYPPPHGQDRKSALRERNVAGG